jgi:hypothetical protein
MKIHFFVVLAAAVAAAPVHAADRLSGPQTAAACAPVPASTLRETAMRIVGAQDVVVRELYSARTHVVIAGGTSRGLQPDQRYYIRREPTGRLQPSGPRVATTAGWLRIVSATESTAVGLVEFACDGVLAGDVLQPYADPAVPAGATLTAAVGEPDFKAAGRVLSGENQRETGTRGDFFLVDVQPAAGSIGARLAIYRDLQTPGVPLAAIADAVVTGTYGGLSVVRITYARDAVRSGDLAVPRRAP